MLVMGDFNAPDIDWAHEEATVGSFGEAFMNLLRDQALAQHVRSFTRWRSGQLPSLLDLIITKGENEVENLKIEEPLGKSDHGVVRLNLSTSGNPAPDKFRRVFKRMPVAELQHAAQKMLWKVKDKMPKVEQEWDLIKSNLNRRALSHSAESDVRVSPLGGKQNPSRPKHKSIRHGWHTTGMVVIGIYWPIKRLRSML